MRHLPHGCALLIALVALLPASCQRPDPEPGAAPEVAVQAPSSGAASSAPRTDGSHGPAPPDGVQPGEMRPPADAPVAARWLAPRAALVRGEQALLGVRLVLAPGWHVYWPGQNDSGAPPHLAPALPEGVSAGAVRWPPPERHVGAGDVLDHVLEDAATLLLPVSVAADAPLGDVVLRARLDWIVCRDVCLMDGAELELPLQIVEAGTAPAARPEDAALLDAAEARLPGGEPAGLTLARDGDALVLRVPGANGLQFFPASDGLPLQDVLGTCAAHADTLRLQRDTRQHGTERLRGVLLVQRPDQPNTEHLVDRALP
ncbi:MAG: hypothetical protein H6825_13210 [Planctomycetes bacterium]|nr:hypothetical protein [Planctomycetota bacterium]